MAIEPADGAQHYDLFTRDGATRLVWRLTDRGVALEPGAFIVRRSGQWTRAEFKRILSVTLSSGQAPGSRAIASCTIQMSSGLRIVVSNLNARGVSDGSRDGIYRQFVADLHARLRDAGVASGVAFRSGFSQARSTGLLVAGLIATGFFVVLPVILLLATHELKALLITAAGLGLVVPIWRTFSANQPGSYNPRLPPDLLR